MEYIPGKSSLTQCVATRIKLLSSFTLYPSLPSQDAQDGFSPPTRRTEIIGAPDSIVFRIFPRCQAREDLKHANEPALPFSKLFFFLVSC